MHHICTFRHLHSKERDLNKKSKLIIEGPIPELPSYTYSFNQLVKKMLEPNPEERATASQILSDPLFEDLTFCSTMTSLTWESDL